MIISQLSDEEKGGEVRGAQMMIVFNALTLFICRL
jgi:hypothetical protein